MEFTLLLMCFLLSGVGAPAVESSPRMLQQQQHYSGLVKPLFETIADMIESSPDRMFNLADRFFDEVRLSAGVSELPDDVIEAIQQLKTLGRQAKSADGQSQQMALDEAGCQTCKVNSQCKYLLVVSFVKLSAA